MENSNRGRTHGATWRFSVKWRLLFAFMAISGFAAVAAASALVSFSTVGNFLHRITQERVPVALDSLTLSRQTERIVTAAPALLSATDVNTANRLFEKLVSEVERANALLKELEERGLSEDELTDVENVVERLKANLAELNQIVASRRRMSRQVQDLLNDLSGVSIAIRRLLGPALLVLESKLTEWHRLRSDNIANKELAKDIAILTPHQQAEFARATVNDALLRSTTVDSLTDLDLMVFPLEQGLNSLDTIVPRLDPALHERMRNRINALRKLVESEKGILASRRRELELTAAAERRLAENVNLSTRLRQAVDELVGSARTDIRKATREALSTQNRSTIVLITLVALSLGTSALIVWLYVGRNLIARLTALSNSMLAVAGGNLRVIVPRSGRDEITDMADALTVFRDTAIEIEEKNLRRADRLLYAILPPAAAQELKATGQVSAKQYENVAILFVDIVGFTSYCERRQPDEIVGALDRLARRSEQILEAENLEKIKTVGDGMLATCNLMERHEDSVMATMRCAARLQKAARNEPPGWRLRAGIHFGSVVGGVIGESKFTFDIWGDAVNVTSRLADLEVDGICLSADAWAQVSGRCSGEALGETVIKGHASLEVFVCHDPDL